MRLILTGLALLFCLQPLLAQERCPSTDTKGLKTYLKLSDLQYRVGLGQHISDVEIAKKAALLDVAQSILLNVKHAATEQTTGKNGADTILYDSVLLVESELDLNMPDFYICQASQGIFALAYVDRTSLLTYYKRRFHDLRLAVSRPLPPISTQAKELNGLWMAYSEAFNQINAMRRYITAMRALGSSETFNLPLAPITLQGQLEQIQQRIPIKNEVDLAREIIRQIALKYPSLQGVQVRLNHFTPFARPKTAWATKFSEMLIQALTIEAQKSTLQWQLSKDASLEDAINLELTGSYERIANKLELRVYLMGKHPRLKEPAQFPFSIPLSQFDLPKTIFEEEPLNPEANILATTISNEDLQVFATTNKGIQSPIFHLNERMYLKVKVNKPAYIHLVYRDANGDSWLMMQRPQEITPNQVNIWTEIYTPFDFKYPPFGKESLYVFATSNNNTISCMVQQEGASYKITNIKECIPRMRGRPVEAIADFHIPITTVSYEQK